MPTECAQCQRKSQIAVDLFLMIEYLASKRLESILGVRRHRWGGIETEAIAEVTGHTVDEPGTLDEEFPVVVQMEALQVGIRSR